jgi:phosphate/sulfate permease
MALLLVPLIVWLPETVLLLITAGGIVPIIASWFISPLAAALFCCFLFVLIRTLVLRRDNSTKIAFYVLPVLIL